jgi:four helix bundle protein
MSPPPRLPYHSLLAYQRSLDLLRAVKAAAVRDAKLRDEATRAAKGTCLNIAEASARYSKADRARAFAIARGEAVEAVAAVEIAALAGDATEEAAARCIELGSEVYALLTSLIR